MVSMVWNQHNVSVQFGRVESLPAQQGATQHAKHTSQAQINYVLKILQVFQLVSISCVRTSLVEYAGLALFVNGLHHKFSNGTHILTRNQFVRSLHYDLSDGTHILTENQFVGSLHYKLGNGTHTHRKPVCRQPPSQS